MGHIGEAGGTVHAACLGGASPSHDLVFINEHEQGNFKYWDFNASLGGLVFTGQATFVYIDGTTPYCKDILYKDGGASAVMLEPVTELCSGAFSQEACDDLPPCAWCVS